MLGGTNKLGSSHNTFAVTKDVSFFEGKFTFSLPVLAFMAMFCSILDWGFGNVDTSSLGNKENYYRILLVAFSAMIALIIILRNMSRLGQTVYGPIVLLGSYGLYAMLSGLLVPAHSLYSMWKALEVTVDVALIAAVLSYPRPQNGARSAYLVILGGYATLMIIWLVEALLMPSTALIASKGLLPVILVGVLPKAAANGLGFTGALIGFVAFCRLLRPQKNLPRLMTMTILCLALITWTLAQSRTSAVALCAALFVFLILDQRYKLLWLLTLTVVLILLSGQALDVIEEYIRRGNTEEQWATLSGRTSGWKAAWSLFLESPVIGHGFVAYARAHILGIQGTSSSLHGSMFEVLVGQGLLGFMPWAAALIWTWAQLLKLARSRHPYLWRGIGRSINAERVGVLTLLTVRGITSSTLAMHEHDFMLLLTVVAYGVAMRQVTVRSASSKAKILRSKVRTYE